MARATFGVTALVVTAGLVLQLVPAITNDSGRFDRRLPGIDSEPVAR